MKKPRKPGLREAYAVKSPEDNMRLYADWAPTYESEFVTDRDYVLWRRVAQLLADHLADRKAPVLDIGCGTGLCGVALGQAGFTNIDGVDISDEMLREAAAKRRSDGEPVYRTLIQGDLTRSIEPGDGTYPGIVSAGTFTHGHLGPECLGEIWRVASAGAICAIGINASHYLAMGFADRIAADVRDNSVSAIDIVDVQTYGTPQPDIANDNDKAKILLCRVNAS